MSARSRCEHLTTNHGDVWWLDETTWVRVSGLDEAHPRHRERQEAVSELLAGRGMVVKARPEQAWTGLHLAVAGSGPLARQVCKELLRSGLGRLDCLDPFARNSEGQAVVRALRARHRARISWVDEVAELAGRGVDLVLVAPDTVEADRLLLAELVRQDIPHLLLGAHGDVGRIGPLVRPGRGPCQGCADLARGQLETAWPQVVAALGCRRARPHPTITGLVAARAVLAVGWLARGVDDGSGLQGRVEVIDLFDPAPRRASFGVHPDCGCRWHPQL
ncbi:hypothetical protein GCM10027030_27740 [Luteococcus sediminum]|uniref:hypothetical protein n=1 Tax=Luteococcus sp. TaxID=1969402 RepID=UPI0037366939